MFNILDIYNIHIFTLSKDVLIELEKVAYTMSESDPVTNICAIVTSNHSHCPVGFQFKVLLVINATREGMMSVSLQPHIYMLLILILIYACVFRRENVFFN